MATVLVVDDEPQVLSALRRALESEGDRVLSAATGTEAIDLAAAQTPELVVLDLWLPDLDGVEVVRRLRGWLDAPILILSGESDATRKVDALDSGADDFLEKPFGFPELTARLRALKRRSVRDRAEQRLVFGPLTVDLPQGSAELDGAPLRLTPTEWQLLQAMVTHPGKLLTHRWLLARVWGESHGDESRQALRTHIRSLRSKIGDDAGTPSYLRTESGAGYRWIPEPERPGEQPAADAAPAPGPAGPSRAEPGTRAATLHDMNNALTALHFSLHVALEGVGRLSATGPDAEHLERVEAQLQRSNRLVDRVGELAKELRQVWTPPTTPTTTDD